MGEYIYYMENNPALTLLKIKTFSKYQAILPHLPNIRGTIPQEADHKRSPKGLGPVWQFLNPNRRQVKCSLEEGWETHKFISDLWILLLKLYQITLDSLQPQPAVWPLGVVSSHSEFPITEENKNNVIHTQMFTGTSQDTLVLLDGCGSSFSK